MPSRKPLLAGTVCWRSAYCRYFLLPLELHAPNVWSRLMTPAWPSVVCRPGGPA